MSQVAEQFGSVLYPLLLFSNNAGQNLIAPFEGGSNRPIDSANKREEIQGYGIMVVPAQTKPRSGRLH